MNTPSTVTDNITELLVKIIEFTHSRQKILYQNINNHRIADFVPKDLAVDEFSRSLDVAINEHVRNRRLVFCDSENVRFGSCGTFKTEAIVDEEAGKLLEANRNEYIELQLNKLMENSLNQRVAAELLRQKQGMVSIFE